MQEKDGAEASAVSLYHQVSGRFCQRGGVGTCLRNEMKFLSSNFDQLMTLNFNISVGEGGCINYASTIDTLPYTSNIWGELYVQILKI